MDTPLYCVRIAYFKNPMDYAHHQEILFEQVIITHSPPGNEDEVKRFLDFAKIRYLVDNKRSSNAQMLLGGLASQIVSVSLTI